MFKKLDRNLAGMVERRQDLESLSPEPQLCNEFSSHLDIGLFLENEEEHCIF